MLDIRLKLQLLYVKNGGWITAVSSDSTGHILHSNGYRQCTAACIKELLEFGEEPVRSHFPRGKLAEINK